MSKPVSSALSRRNFLTTAATAGSAMLLGPRWLDAAEQPLRAQNVGALEGRIAPVLAKTIGIDMHNHIYPTGTEPHPQHGPQGSPRQGGPSQGPPPPRQEETPSLALTEALKDSGLTAVCASFVLDFAQNNKPGDARANFLHWLDAIDAELKKGHIHRALTLSDLEAAHTREKPTIVQTVEGAHFIEGHPDRIQEVYKRGLRHLQLLHDRDDMISPLGDTVTNPPHLGGLTPMGTEVIKECNRLGILVDMAHASHETVLGALKVATQPLIISHTNLDTWTGKDLRIAEMMKPRLISKEHAKVVADAGGVVGVWTHLTATLSEFVESIKAMVDAIGVDHVGIGSDTDLLSTRSGGGTSKVWPELNAQPGEQIGFLPAIVGVMLHHGFTLEEIHKIGGGNYCRVFGKVTAGHT